MILVTGGTGLLGSHLLLELAKQGKKIRALMRKNSSIKQVEHVFKAYHVPHLLNDIQWQEGDVTDIYSLSDALQNVKYVYHCASVISFDPKDETLLLKTNIEGTANIMNACLEMNIEKVCHVSSVAALNNNIAGQEITENIFWKSSPYNSIYSISKYGAEREAWRAMEEGLKVVIVNPSVILGASVLSNGSNAILQKAKKGNRFYTNGQTGFVDAVDVAEIMIRLMENNYYNERFIISSENMTYKEFYTIANAAFGKKPPTIYCGKLITALGWRMAKLFSLFTGTKPVITRDIARAAHNNKRFSNEKVRRKLDYSFLSVRESLKRASNLFPDG